MSAQTPRSSGRFIAIGTAALLIRIGITAAAQPPSIRERIQAVLTGSMALDAAPRADAPRHASGGRDTDSQAFVRRLLLGRDAFAVDATRWRRVHGANRPAGGNEGIEAMVRRQLLGESD